MDTQLGWIEISWNIFLIDRYIIRIYTRFSQHTAQLMLLNRNDRCAVLHSGCSPGQYIVSAKSNPGFVSSVMDRNFFEMTEKN